MKDTSGGKEKWEYKKVMILFLDIVEILTEESVDGWESIAIIPREGLYAAFFKRIKPTDNA